MVNYKINKEQRELQWTKKCLSLSAWENAGRSFPLILIILLNAILIYRHFYEGDDFGTGEKLFGVISFFLSILFVNWLMRSRKFQIIQTKLNEADFKKLVNSTAIDLGWNIEVLQSSYAICQQNHGWQTYGIRITIMRKSNSVAFNSMVEPFLGSNPFTGGWNKKNYKIFKRNLLNQRAGIDILSQSESALAQEELNYLKENERSFRNTLKRTIFYTMSFAFLITGLIMIFKGHGIGILLILFSIPYFIFDYKALKEKVRLLKKLKKTNPNNGEHP